MSENSLPFPPVESPSSVETNPSPVREKLFFLSAGEPSGDIHAAALVRALKKRYPSARFVAYGGDAMENAGCEVPVKLTALAVMWFGRALWNLRTFWGYLKSAEKFFADEKPDLVILVDFPGFNWLIAKRAKALSIPVAYFMPPQLWAWGSWRVAKMRRSVDFCLCTLPFEERWLTEHGVTAYYIGHPFFSETRAKRLDPSFLESFTASGESSQPILLILPGSRMQEVTANTPDMLRAAIRLMQTIPNVRPVVGAFNKAQGKIVQEKIASLGVDIPVYVGRTHELMATATVAIAVSGSVSMELLARKVPTVIYYRVGRVSHLVMRFFRRVKYITLVNILAADAESVAQGEETTADSIYYPPHVRMIPKEPTVSEKAKMIFPEFLVDRDRSAEASDVLIDWLSDSGKYAETQRRLTDLLMRLDDGSDPVEKGADFILRQDEDSSLR